MPRQALAFALAFGAIAVAGAAQARITEIRIDAVEPFAEGQAFGEVGSYLRITGVAKGELDPFSPQNKVIVDLDKAPRNARGMVEYEVDIFVLRPADPARGNGLLFYEVLNRGNKQIGQRLHDLIGRRGRWRRTIPGPARTPATAFCSSAATPSCGRDGIPTCRRATPPWAPAFRWRWRTAGRWRAASARRSRSASADRPTSRRSGSAIRRFPPTRAGRS